MNGEVEKLQAAVRTARDVLQSGIKNYVGEVNDFHDEIGQALNHLTVADRFLDAEIKGLD